MLSRCSTKSVVRNPPNTILAKFQAIYLRGIKSTFPSHNLFFRAGADDILTLFNPSLKEFIDEMTEVRNARFTEARFLTLGAAGEPAVARFELDVVGQPPM